MILNLDTHILLFAITAKLQPAEQRLLENSRWSISSIVWWEIAKLAQLSRINTQFNEEFIKRRLRRLHVWPITVEVAYTSTQLDFRGDPADEIIAATSIVHNVPLLTRDRGILDSKLVPFAH